METSPYDEANIATIDSAAQVVVIRPDPLGGFIAAIGIGGTTRHLSGRFRSREEAEAAGLEASREEYARQSAEILEARKLAGTVQGIPLAPHIPSVIQCGIGQSAWQVYAGVESPGINQPNVGTPGPQGKHPLEEIKEAVQAATESKNLNDIQRALLLIGARRNKLVVRQHGRNYNARRQEEITTLGDLYREVRALEGHPA